MITARLHLGSRPPARRGTGTEGNLAVVVPLVAVAAVCQGEGLEERQGLVPGVALAAAWVFELGS